MDVVLNPIPFESFENAKALVENTISVLVTACSNMNTLSSSASAVFNLIRKFFGFKNEDNKKTLEDLAELSKKQIELAVRNTNYEDLLDFAKNYNQIINQGHSAVNQTLTGCTKSVAMTANYGVMTIS